MGEPEKGIYVLMTGLDSERLVLSGGPLGYLIFSSYLINFLLMRILNGIAKTPSFNGLTVQNLKWFKILIPAINSQI